ncbi:nicotinate-nucleotide--dimethylbenzimidazole phosphoribosyltransferase [Catenovulum sp. 2E275]|uniref:nicotinate-nucleotide--dimethylbenzimidazole phosphoribosyltransferase n=1 Tax=Catenovulum sp. 2E275 TaxID=2980497 RepID=UPI0021CFFCDF|nr:nicotinate-nucleotide--dimethylbenzimidazole phosphoribosyltransferase [Catenovulum sp. 2E275]MCU4674647.1 nicotinate-nucleotide--dimethylbenzimidazole phosphoribosyltransferase [Catenovulum sp. 2E275]
MNWQIKPIDQTYAEPIQQHIDQKTKPLGSLGQLEILAKQLALITNTCAQQNTIKAQDCRILIFAADHGIAEQGVSIAPAEVTGQMVANFVNGGAAINCFCRANQIDLKVIDAGVKFPPNLQSEQLINQWIAAGTLNIVEQAAMSETQVQKALKKGAEIANQQINEGADILGFGEMGIANTSAASALLSAILALPVEQTVGRGTGISDLTFKHKQALIEQALTRVLNQYQLSELAQIKQSLSPIQILAELGGFEIAQMVGAMLQSAECGRAIVVDGFIVSVAALIASQIEPAINAYFVFAHQSDEKAHQIVLDYFSAQPLLQLGLRLGEGTGAALAMPLIKSAAEFYNQMATFASASISPVEQNSVK